GEVRRGRRVAVYRAVRSNCQGLEAREIGRSYARQPPTVFLSFLPCSVGVMGPVRSQMAATAASVSAKDKVSAFAEAVGQPQLHLLRSDVRHPVAMGVQARHQPPAEPPDHTGHLDSLRVVLAA